MIYIFGTVTPEEKEDLQKRGYVVEPASQYGVHWEEGNNHKGSGKYLADPPPKGKEMIVVFIDKELYDSKNIIDLIRQI